MSTFNIFKELLGSIRKDATSGCCIIPSEQNEELKAHQIATVLGVFKNLIKELNKKGVKDFSQTNLKEKLYEKIGSDRKLGNKNEEKTDYLFFNFFDFYMFKLSQQEAESYSELEKQANVLAEEFFRIMKMRTSSNNKAENFKWKAKQEKLELKLMELNRIAEDFQNKILSELADKVLKNYF